MIFTRPQAFHGKLHEAISSVLSACEAVPYLIQAGIAIREKTDTPIDIYIDMDTVSGPWDHIQMID